MQATDNGSYTTHGKDHQKLLIEWSKVGALSEAFASKMRALATMGIDSFLSVETEFLTHRPQAVEEDPSLSSLKGLTDAAIEEAIRKRLHGMFHADPSDLNDELRKYLSNVFYYFVTLKEKDSDKVLAFITFMGGPPYPEGHYKITILAVDPSSRRKGFANALIDSIQKIGVNPLHLSVSTRPTNSAALAAYRKAGFGEDTEATKHAPPHFVEGHWTHLFRKE